MLGDEALRLCLLNVQMWPALSSLAGLALEGAGCAAHHTHAVTFTDLLGCSQKAPTVEELCGKTSVFAPRTLDGRQVLQADHYGSVEAFWGALRGALRKQPGLELAFGYPPRPEPHLMRSVNFSDLVAAGMADGTDAASSMARANPPRASVYLEFGVFNASSLNFIAQRLKEAATRLGQDVPLVHGFDSFEGLPQDWRKADDDGVGSPSSASRKAFAKGSFSLTDSNKLPDVEENARLVKGWYNITVPTFVQGLLRAAARQRKSPPQARLVHVDCDLYGSTLEVLRPLRPLLGPGTVLVFDELVNYPGFLTGEMKALYELLLTGTLGRNVTGLRVLYAPWRLASSDEELEDLAAAGVDEWSLWQSVGFELLR